jgi:paraquat-inducible protein A
VKTAANLNIVSCSRCAALWKAAKAGDRCGCGAKLHARKPDSLRRTWAFVIAACILYFPANILPVTVTTSFPEGEQQDTIMSGIIYFWVSGSWVVAAIIFIASFVVPLFKLAVMILLLITVQLRSNWQLLLRTKLYRAVEVIGRWSMLDVFVVSFLTGLVQIDGFVTVYPGPGIAAFAVVVILTMLASMSFDPRLLWDAAEGDAAERDPEVSV